MGGSNLISTLLAFNALSCLQQITKQKWHSTFSLMFKNLVFPRSRKFGVF